MSPRLPVLPLRDVVLFPHVAMPLLVGRAGSIAAVAAATDGAKEVVLVTQRSADVHSPVPTDLHRVAIVARLQQVIRLNGGTTKILVEGISRVRVQRFFASKSGPLLEARVTPFPLGARPQVGASKRAGATIPQAELTASVRHALTLFEDYAALQRRLAPEVVGLLQSLEDEERMLFGIAAHLQVSIEHRQRLLESPTIDVLADRLVSLLNGELELLKLEKKIDEQVRGSLFQNQREFFLQEQLRAIHKELGHDEGDEHEELTAQIAARGLPEQVATRAHRERRS